MHPKNHFVTLVKKKPQQLFRIAIQSILITLYDRDIIDISKKEVILGKTSSSSSSSIEPLKRNCRGAFSFRVFLSSTYTHLNFLFKLHQFTSQTSRSFKVYGKYSEKYAGLVWNCDSSVCVLQVQHALCFGIGDQKGQIWVH